MITLGTLRFVQVTTCHANLLNQKQDMSHEQANFQNSLFCSCLFSGRITTAINTANDYTDDVLQNGFGTNPVWLIREKVMSASRNRWSLFNGVVSNQGPDKILFGIHCKLFVR